MQIEEMNIADGKFEPFGVRERFAETRDTYLQKLSPFKILRGKLQSQTGRLVVILEG